MRTLSIVSLLALVSCLKGDVGMGTDTNPSTTEPTTGGTNIGMTTSANTSTDSSSSVTTGMTMTSSSTDVSTTSSGPMCGDGVPEGDEECDDGNLISDDGCSPTCTNECGDGTKQPSEECDEGGSNSDMGACTTQCRTAKCGDGLVHKDVEACDGGELDINGNPTPTNSADCDSDCSLVECGDTILNEVAGEECQDGNMIDDDECSNTCAAPRIVFVTSGTFVGALGGLAGADEKCAMAAQTAGLPGTWRAWLSDGTENGSPAGRFDTMFSGFYKRVDGVPVAHGWAGLGGALLAKIEVTENNAVVGNPKSAWTNINQGGTAADKDNHCGGWTSESDQSSAVRGSLTVMDAGWTNAGVQTCDNDLHLYCFQNPS